ncbi:Rho termination factor N-terminal domain-containing protein, partial [Actinoalloteichus caeruleus]
MSNTELLSGEAGTAASAADQPEADKPKSRKGSAAKGEVPHQADNGAAPRRRGGLSGMVMAELRQLAGELGITSTTGMRKGDLIAAIKERQGGGSAKTDTAAQLPFGSGDQGKTEQTSADAPAQPAPSRRSRGASASE